VQIKAVDDFAKINSKYFIVARSPQEVRHYLKTTTKTIFIHSIEGGRKLIHSQEDAIFWAKKGVAFITLIHLMDDEFGGAAFNPDVITPIINYKGSLRRLFHFKKRRGLTPMGKEAILWIANAGMMVDLTHMSPESKIDVLKVMDMAAIPPLMTHSMYRPIYNHDRGVTREQLLKIYQLGGLFSLPINGGVLVPHKEEPTITEKLARFKLCRGSLDHYKFAFDTVSDFIDGNASSILKLPIGVSFADLTEAQKTQLSVGWQSDFNGWTNHSRPRYGKNGCFDIPLDQDIPLVDRIGLAHPGLLSQYWNVLEKEGMRIDSLKRASEKFLQIWSKMRERVYFNEK